MAPPVSLQGLTQDAVLQNLGAAGDAGSQSRADVLATALAAVLLLTGLQWSSVKAGRPPQVTIKTVEQHTAFFLGCQSCGLPLTTAHGCRLSHLGARIAATLQTSFQTRPKQSCNGEWLLDLLSQHGMNSFLLMRLQPIC